MDSFSKLKDIELFLNKRSYFFSRTKIWQKVFLLIQPCTNAHCITFEFISFIFWYSPIWCPIWCWSYFFKWPNNFLLCTSGKHIYTNQTHILFTLHLMTNAASNDSTRRVVDRTTCWYTMQPEWYFHNFQVLVASILMNTGPHVWYNKHWCCVALVTPLSTWRPFR